MNSLSVFSPSHGVRWNHLLVGLSYGVHVYWGPLHTQDWEPMTIKVQALSLVEKAGPVQVRFTLRLREQQSMWLHDGWKAYMGSHMASNGTCFMVTWTIFQIHLLEVDLTQNHWETMALWMLTIVDLLYVYHVRGAAWIKIHLNIIWLRPRSCMTSHYTWGLWPLHDFGGVLGWPLDPFFRPLTISWSRLLARVFSGLEIIKNERVSYSMYMYDKVFAGFSLLTRKNLHKKINARQLTRTL